MLERDLQARNNITVSTLWDLAASTGMSSPGCLLKLEAGNDIIINSDSLGDESFFNHGGITAGSGWSVTLEAGRDFSSADKIQVGVGNIIFNGLTTLEAQDGAINLLAGNDITVNGGHIRTMGGGSITAHALAGNIDAGSDAQGYVFTSGGSVAQSYNLSHGVGGISTGAGGDLSLTAGGNITTVLPIAGTSKGSVRFVYDGNFRSQVASGNTDFATAGSGAYGSGNVSVVAGGNITGHFQVANGIGDIAAGVQMDADGNPMVDGSGNYVLGSTGSAGTGTGKAALSLGLIKGGWNVQAGQDIFLQEVSNPNGIFNTSGTFSHTFDYAPDAFVNLSAYQVSIGEGPSSLPRSDKSLSVPMIFAPILNVNAGQGGITLRGGADPFNQLILYPSPLGSLTMNTTDGGSLGTSLSSALYTLVVSDSGRNRFQKKGDFGINDHAATPVHLGSETPLSLNISGDMNLIGLAAPEAAQITVGGNMNNCSFQGMNLSPLDNTTIAVTGDILNRSAFTSVDLNGVPDAAAPDLFYLARALNNDLGIPATTLSSSFFYDPVTKIFTYQNIPNQSLAKILALLQNLPVQEFINGVPQWNDPGPNTDPKMTTVSVLNAETAAALLTQFNLQGPIPSDIFGYNIGGGGKFIMSARNIDLGTTPGLQSKGAGLYRVGNSFPLANIFNKGADIFVNTVEDLNMYSTAIASLNGGNIDINVGGDVNVGSSTFSVTALGARGIFSTSQGNVTVIADGNINVNGSRIAAYDGGDVTVKSLNGNIDAGSGGSGFVILTAYYVNPITHQVFISSPTIPGSGILTTTFLARTPSYPAPPVVVGNILVEALNGNINCSVGGVIQDPLNKVNDPNATVEVLAGYELRDADGNPVTASGIAGSTRVKISEKRNIDAGNSGIIGNTVIVKCTGDLLGLLFARDNLDATALNHVNVVALAGKDASVSGDTVTGKIIGIGGINVSGGSVDASLLSNGSISGGTSGQSGMTQGTAANAASQGAALSDEAPKAVASTDETEEDKQKEKKEPTTITKTGRVTVILPKKS